MRVIILVLFLCFAFAVPTQAQYVSYNLMGTRGNPWWGGGGQNFARQSQKLQYDIGPNSSSLGKWEVMGNVVGSVVDGGFRYLIVRNLSGTVERIAEKYFSVDGKYAVLPNNQVVLRPGYAQLAGANPITGSGSSYYSSNYPPIERWNGYGFDSGEVKTDERWLFDKTNEYVRSGYTPTLAAEMALRDYLSDLEKRESLREKNKATRAALFENVVPNKTGLVSGGASKLEEIDGELKNLKNAVNTLSGGMEELRKALKSPPTGEAKPPADGKEKSSFHPYSRDLLNRPEDGGVNSPTDGPSICRASIEPDNRLYEMDAPPSEEIVKFPDGSLWKKTHDRAGRTVYTIFRR